jgi:hypothetical protein
LVLAVLVFVVPKILGGHPDQEDETEVEAIIRKYDATVEAVQVPTTASYDDDGEAEGKESSCTPPQNTMLPELEAAQLQRRDNHICSRNRDEELVRPVWQRPQIDNEPD